jgi:hypothetical protein
MWSWASLSIRRQVRALRCAQGDREADLWQRPARAALPEMQRSGPIAIAGGRRLDVRRTTASQIKSRLDTLVSSGMAHDGADRAGSEWGLRHGSHYGARWGRGCVQTSAGTSAAPTRKLAPAALPRGCDRCFSTFLVEHQTQRSSHPSYRCGWPTKRFRDLLRARLHLSPGFQAL